MNQTTTEDATDDLSTPLGQQMKRKPAWLSYRLPFTLPQALAVLLGLVLLTFLGYAIFNDDPLGGEPMAKIVLKPDAAKTADNKGADKMAPNAMAPPAAPAATPAMAPKSPPAGEQKTVTIIDGSSGARRDVTVPGNDADAAAPAPASSAPPVMANINPQLLESTRYGMVPIIAGNLRPSQAYAGGNDALRARAATMPAIAIVVTGLGIGAAKTTDAIMKLPGAVTLAFTPYGADPGKLVERARSAGHEILLQVPLEPFDYPDNDPGPQTLLTTLTPEQNLDRLLWLLSRFQGYVGLSNFMGARFLPHEASMQPLIREAALTCGRLELRQRAVDLAGVRHGVDGCIRLGKRHGLGQRQLGGEAARRGAVVEIGEPAFCGFANQRLHRCLVGQEARAHEVA